MTHTACKAFFGVLTAAALLSAAAPAAAQRQAAPAPAQTVQAAPRVAVDGDQTAEQTRERLMQLLQNYPPTLGRVLKLDPSLLDSPAYLNTYPSLAAFIAQHPEVAHNPDFFLERVFIDRSSFSVANDPRWQQREQFNRLLNNFSVFLVFLVITGVVVWLIRLVVQQRRWNRMSKVQFDTHAKLLDRFTSNEDLLAYIQTPAGRRFLEAIPIPTQEQPAAIGAPLSRILWSVQAGVVLVIGGLGLLYISTRFIDDAAQFFVILGVMALALGAGFIISAGAAYVLSRRLGLMDRPQTSIHA